MPALLYVYISVLSEHRLDVVRELRFVEESFSCTKSRVTRKVLWSLRGRVLMSQSLPQASDWLECAGQVLDRKAGRDSTLGVKNQVTCGFEFCVFCILKVFIP